MKFLIACDSFKGSLSSTQVCTHIADTLRKYGFNAVICPLADGGEGTVEAFSNALECQIITATVHDPYMREITAEYIIADKTAVIEMASASGITLLEKSELNPELTSTYGTGELLLHAIKMGCTKIIIGIGGSATNDGGAGCLEALGATFKDKYGEPLAHGGAALNKLDEIDLTNFKKVSNHAELIIACDVISPLYGENGASRVFAPQKGADQQQTESLENALTHFGEKSKNMLGTDYAMLPGAGAAGGLGFALVGYCGGQLTSGFDALSNALGLEDKIKASDIIITGEGKTDHSTLLGKLPLRVSALAKEHNKPCFLISGDIDDGIDTSMYFQNTYKCRQTDEAVESAIENAQARLISATEKLLNELKDTL